MPEHVIQFNQVWMSLRFVYRLSCKSMVHHMTQHSDFTSAYLLSKCHAISCPQEKRGLPWANLKKKTHRSSSVTCIPVLLVNVDSMDTKFGEYFLMFWRVIMPSSLYHELLKHQETFTHPTRLYTAVRNPNPAFSFFVPTRTITHDGHWLHIIIHCYLLLLCKCTGIR